MDWFAWRGFFFLDVMNEPTMGRPQYGSVPGGTISYSRFNVGAVVREKKLSLRGWLPGQFRQLVLVTSAVAPLVSLLLTLGKVLKRFARSVCVIQAIFAALFLLSAEGVLGDWLALKLNSAFFLELLTKGFDVLWWVVPALLLVLAVERFIWNPIETQTGQTIPTIVRRSVAFVIILLAAVGVIAFVFDRKLSSLLATSGVIAMILGLALQINISNIFSGIALNMERPFRIGDWIMVHGRREDPELNIIGRVVDINWRTTRLETTNKSTIVIPNSQISEKTVTNFMTPREVSRFELTFCIDYSVAHERAIEVITAGVKAIIGRENNGPLAEPPPKVRANGTTPMGVEYLVRYHIIPREVSPSKARDSITRSVLKHLREAGIPLAYPRQNLYVDQLPARPAGPMGKS
jgi:branched-chain amino acid transport system substrate-binding protein